MATGRRIAIVGSGGNLGKPSLKALLSKGVHTITAIQRKESMTEFSPEVIVKKGSFADESFLVESLRGQDVLIIIVPIPNMDLGDLFIKAAIDAGVPYILPTEFGVDSPKAVGEHSMMAPKVARRDLIEKSGTSSWIAVISNFWLDLNIQIGLWGFDVKGRKADLFRGADAKISTTTLARTGEGVAALLSLPEADLVQYQNSSFYISSFELSQRDIFGAIKKATGTTDADWNITERDAAEIVRECGPKIKAGDGFAEWTRLFAMFFQGMDGSNYEEKAVDLSKYGVPAEDLDKVVYQAVNSL
ncbi:NAD(P)-binding protein [Trichoderma chlorosporum]